MKHNWIFPTLFQRIRQNETGSALPSALLLLFIFTAFLTRFSSVVRNQVLTHIFLQDGYQTKAMIALTEIHLKEEREKDRNEMLGEFVFDKGTVNVSRTDPDTLLFQVAVENRFTLSETRYHPAKVEEPEESEEDDSSAMGDQEKTDQPETSSEKNFTDSSESSNEMDSSDPPLPQEDVTD